ncbi:hypothetical protein CRG98_036913 [Punica granatum]|uniref:Uncharacterized protein n=1 Tax=Punica granatum TaxID=22663 RepID=A0A2I0IF38_PUNGR|nr:hypothetical protein CRG98_036913 [Punica granatum]
MADGKSDVSCASLKHDPCIIYDGRTHLLIFLENSNPMDHEKKCNSAENHLMNLSRTMTMSLGTVLSREEVRDKRDSLMYYSKGCNYCIEIKCVMPELTLLLTGKSKHVELRTLGRCILSGKVIIKGLSPEEVQKYVAEGEESSCNVSRAHPTTWNFGRTDQSYFHYLDQTHLNFKDPVVAPSSSPDVAAIILVVTLPKQDRVNYLQNSLRKGCLGKEMKVQPIIEHVIGGPLPWEHLQHKDVVAVNISMS